MMRPTRNSFMMRPTRVETLQASIEINDSDDFCSFHLHHVKWLSAAPRRLGRIQLSEFCAVDPTPLRLYMLTALFIPISLVVVSSMSIPLDFIPCCRFDWNFASILTKLYGKQDSGPELPGFHTHCKISLLKTWACPSISKVDFIA